MSKQGLCKVSEAAAMQMIQLVIQTIYTIWLSVALCDGHQTYPLSRLLVSDF